MKGCMISSPRSVNEKPDKKNPKNTGFYILLLYIFTYYTYYILLLLSNKM